MTEHRRADDETLSRALDALPIFPLGNTVFFPHTLLPLHVFEPRYRQMTEHVIAGHSHMAIVLHDPPAAPSLKKSPVGGVAAIAGLGRVVHHERLSDGRFHILLQGVARVELVEELPLGEVLYRRVRARKLSSRDDDTVRIGRELSTLKNCYARLTESMPASKDTLGDLPLRLDDPCVVGDVVCAAALDDVALRQQALEEIDVGARLCLANEALATLLLKSLACEESGMH